MSSDISDLTTTWVLLWAGHWTRWLLEVSSKFTRRVFNKWLFPGRDKSCFFHKTKWHQHKLKYYKQWLQNLSMGSHQMKHWQVWVHWWHQSSKTCLCTVGNSRQETWGWFLKYHLASQDLQVKVTHRAFTIILCPELLSDKNTTASDLSLFIQKKKQSRRYQIYYFSTVSLNPLKLQWALPICRLVPCVLGGKVHLFCM